MPQRILVVEKISPTFTHVDEKNQPRMVNISHKEITERMAVAMAEIKIPPQLAQLWHGQEWQSKKGPVLQTAVLAGIMAAKKTSELIPLCHVLPLSDCAITIEYDATQNSLIIFCRVMAQAKTGVEMEALTGATVSALTIYDMCKAISHEIVISNIRLIEKTGGKSGDFPRKISIKN